jgi:hypothetical protein
VQDSKRDNRAPEITVRDLSVSIADALLLDVLTAGLRAETPHATGTTPPG